MAEKQKDSPSSAKSAEKTSLSDLDIGKDFLTSWKSMSVTVDDPMDFDFSKVGKGTKNVFKFDNLDMDFNLDNDFGKMSSFNVDIPDLDVSSPLKKSAKPNEKSKEVSTDEKTKGKSNRSTFQFDFNEFDNVSFGPSLMKKAKQTNANQDAEISLSSSGSLSLKETVVASEGETTSKFDSQLCAESDSRSKEKLQTLLVGVHIPSKSEITKDQATNVGAKTSPQKPNSNSTQETFQDNRPKYSSLEPYAKDECRNSFVQSVSENSSTHQTGSDSQEEFGCLAEKERTNSGREQSLFHDKTDIGIDCGDSQIDKFPVDMAGSQSNDGGNSQFSGDNPVRVDGKYNAESGQGDSLYEQTFTSASKQVLRETEADGETMDLTLELVRQSNSETTRGDREMSDSKRLTEIATFDSRRIETVQLSCSDKGATMDDKAMADEESLPNIRSKSFKGLDDRKSYPRQESLSLVKVGSIGRQRITTSQTCTADERKLDNQKVESGSKFVSLPKPRSLSTVQTKGDSMYIRGQGTPSNQTSNRGRFNFYDTGRILTSTSRLHDMDVAKGEPVLNGSENNVKDLNTFRYNNCNGRSPSGRGPHRTGAQSGSKSVLLKAVPKEQIEGDSVRTRSEGNSEELTSNRGGCNSDNTGRTLMCTSMLHDKDATKGEVVSDGCKNNMKYLSTLRISETIHPPSKLIPQKDTKLVTNLGQGADLKENTGPRMATYHADTREQAPLSPTLKRKNIEESSANLVMLKPTKRLFLSHGGSRESPEKLVDKENLPDDNTKKVLHNSKSSFLQFPHKVDVKEQETLSKMDNDTKVENADACAKELDILVNMLKKKREEAKEILVRAVVNNNKLLMLNHPIYEEKFRMIEKFGALWLSK